MEAQAVLTPEPKQDGFGRTSLQSPVSTTVFREERELIAAQSTPLTKQFAVPSHTEMTAFQKMSGSTEGKGSNKQLHILVSEIKALRKDLKNNEENPVEVKNHLLRETIIQSRNLFR